MSDSAPRHLLLEVRLEAGRFHGEPEWPPSPARAFQALVAAAARRAELDARDEEALVWLESLPPPLIAAPRSTSGQAVKLWVPNNDLDSRGGDPSEVQNIRAGKWVRPRLFDGSVPLLYAWPLPHLRDEVPPARVSEIARDLYQLGRGVDMAHAAAKVVEADELREVLAAAPYEIHRPAPGSADGGRSLLCPRPGSLESLQARYAASLVRFEPLKKGAVFRQPPKARFLGVPYDAAPPRALFELRPLGEMGAFSGTALARAAQLTEAVRDTIAERLSSALGDRAGALLAAITGRADGDREAPPSDARVRIVPLPSIGHEHVDRAIRRVLIEVPHLHGHRADDVFWAASGLELTTPAGAEAVLVRAGETKMLGHYAADGGAGARRFRTVTAAALPAARRRIAPERVSEEAKPASEREAEEARAREAVIQALRHAQVASRVRGVRVQREPFEAKGARAEAFAEGTRFEKERLWHVEVELRDRVGGPLLLGDGRFLGLGLMAPVREAVGPLAYAITSGLEPGAAPARVADALRRAVMARLQAHIGSRDLPALVSGHRKDGAPARTGVRLAYVFDPAGERLLVLPVGAYGGFLERRDRAIVEDVARAMEGFSELRAGEAGLLRLEPLPLAPSEDPLFAPSRRFRSRTPYTVNRHERAGDAEAALAADVQRSLLRAGYPPARVEVDRHWAEPGVGIRGEVTLDFQVAVEGPLLLGRDRFKGGGLFAGLGDA